VGAAGAILNFLLAKSIAEAFAGKPTVIGGVLYNARDEQLKALVQTSENGRVIFDVWSPTLRQYVVDKEHNRIWDPKTGGVFWQEYY
jgi:hypothetical protein